jgi:hypothetical protein
MSMVAKEIFFRFSQIFTFVTLQVFRAPYLFPVLSIRYLSSGRYKNEKFLKNVVR